MKTGDGNVSSAHPDYHPYQVSADFNGDGREDFAVVVIDQAKAKPEGGVHSFPFALLVFNGPFSNNTHPQPAFFRSGLQLLGMGMVLDPRNNKVGVGEFGKDGVPLIPRGLTYSFDLPVTLGISRGIGILDLLVQSRLVTSIDLARSLIRAGSVRFDDRILSNEATRLNTGGWLEVGKDPNHQVVFLELDPK